MDRVRARRGRGEGEGEGRGRPRGCEGLAAHTCASPQGRVRAACGEATGRPFTAIHPHALILFISRWQVERRLGGVARALEPLSLNGQGGGGGLAADGALGPGGGLDTQAAAALLAAVLGPQAAAALAAAGGAAQGGGAGGGGGGAVVGADLPSPRSAGLSVLELQRMLLAINRIEASEREFR